MIRPLFQCCVQNMMTCKVAIIGVLLSDKDNLRYNTEKFCKKVQVLMNLNCNCKVLFLLVQGRKYFLYNEEMLFQNNPSMTQIFTVEIQVVHILLLAIPFLPTSLLTPNPSHPTGHRQATKRGTMSLNPPGEDRKAT